MEKNGKGKEYNFNTGKLIFEGEYLNGKRNGKGKKYELHLIYDGEFFDDKRQGKGKIYDIYKNDKLYIMKANF